MNIARPCFAFPLLLLGLAAPALARDRSVAAVAQAPEAWITADDYPATALRDGREGVSVVRWEVSTEGKAENCSVTASSGSADLDQAACAAIISRARYTPATDKKGRPIRSTAERRVRWTMPIAQPATTVPYVLRGF